ncbi:MAG: hypothetical protein E6370_15010 [Clostridiales bacterium]|nr:hypothetical protein [Clostridiales bacterium]MDU6975616.1 hypothetical protein [Clostridiales bacterium]
MWKRKILVALVGVLSVTGVSSIYANDLVNVRENYIIVPYMDYINDATVGLKITSDGEAQVRSSIVGYSSSVDKIKIEATLQQYKNGKWTDIKTWSKSYSSYKGNLGETYQVSKGYSYRVVSKFTAYSGSKMETQTVTGSEVKY